MLMVVVQRLAVPLGQAFGGLVTRKLSDSARFFTWCITPGSKARRTGFTTKPETACYLGKGHFDWVRTKHNKASWIWI